jgi:hypothetical protein
MKTVVGNNGENNFSVIERYYYSILTSVICILSLVTDWYIFLAQTLMLVTVLMVLHRLGKGIVLRELIALHGLFTCIFIPIFGYTVYNQSNALAVLWVRVMPVPLDVYFSFALPAMSAFVTTLCWPIRVNGLSDQGHTIFILLNKLKPILRERPLVGVYIVITGILAYYLSTFLPDSFYFVATLIFWSSFAGMLYIYFTEGYKLRKLLLLLFSMFIVMTAIRSGMFTIVAYMGITLFSFLFLGKNIKFINKLFVFVLAVVLLFIVQAVKNTYRQMTWRQNYAGNQVALFGNLAAKKINTFSDLLSKEALFPIYSRANQGYNVALVMRRIPTMQEHDNGTILLRNVAASIIPRLLWPDKPEAGGQFNMQFYAGMRIKGWSTNIGPLGEAYGSFGTTGGILYMFFLGVFIRWAYRTMFKIINSKPLLFFWIPVLFYQVTFSMETDTLQIMNSLFKGAFFIWLLFKLLPSWFGIAKNKAIRYISRGQLRHDQKKLDTLSGS